MTSRNIEVPQFREDAPLSEHVAHCYCLALLSVVVTWFVTRSATGLMSQPIRWDYLTHHAVVLAHWTLVGKAGTLEQRTRAIIQVGR